MRSVVRPMVSRVVSPVVVMVSSWSVSVWVRSRADGSSYECAMRVLLTLWVLLGGPDWCRTSVVDCGRREGSAFWWVLSSSAIGGAWGSVGGGWISPGVRSSE